MLLWAAGMPRSVPSLSYVVVALFSDGVPACTPGDGERNLIVRGQPIDIALDGDRVTIHGRGLQPFKAPDGFQASLTADGVPCWQGQLAVGKQMSLQDASHP